MDHFESLLGKAKDEGVQVFGVAPTSIPGRGVGIAATRELEKGEVIMNIPVEAIRSLHTIPQTISHKLSVDMSIHGLLAAELALDHTKRTDWVNVIPTWRDLEATIPLLWPDDLQRLLPKEAKDLLTKQKANVARDWEMFRNGFPSVNRQDYLYAWLLVSSRAFYCETPETMLFPWHDRLALLPVADLFNHADTGCSVSFSTESYTVTTDRSYSAGEELCTSYGEHSNDFLLAEYGFLLNENQWDQVCLDDLVLPRLSSDQKAMLQKHGSLGNFMLHAGSKRCDNTWMVLQLICSTEAQRQGNVVGSEGAQDITAKAEKLLQVLLGEYLDRIMEIQKEVSHLLVGQRSQRALLAQRWKQIETIVRQAVVATMPEV